MATYDYKCRKCGHTFEVITSLSEHEREPRPACPKCQSKETEQLVEPVNVITVGRDPAGQARAEEKSRMWAR
jgi:putative FmdB family regulatory protein